MSRSALWRQEGNVKERERRAEEIFQLACEEGRTRSKSTLQLWGPDNDTFHFNPLLLQNTIQSPYFQKCCTELKDWTAVIDEIYYEVKHIRVFQIAKQPSTAFCLLLRLLCLRMTSHELDQTIRHVDSPYIRAIGFLFLRFGGCTPDDVWGWIEPFLQDDEEFSVEQGKQSSNAITMGDFIRKLFQERDYYGSTPLPRFPSHIERDLQVKLLAADKIAERAKQHYKNQQRMKLFESVGCQIRALYGDEENPIAWYDAVVDRVITRSDDGERSLRYPKFVVTFTAYGNTETVTLGEIDARGGDGDDANNNNRLRNIPAGPSYTGHGRGYDNGRKGYDDRRSSYRYPETNDRRPQRRNDEHSLYDEVRRAEQEKVASSDKGHWARRPPSTKSNLASKGTQSVHDEINKPKHRPAVVSSTNTPNEHGTSPTPPVPPPRKRTSEEIAAIEEKKRKLLSRYG